MVTTVRLDGKEVLVESNGTKTKSQQAHLAACTGFPGTAAGLAGGTERKPQAVVGARKNTQTTSA